MSKASEWVETLNGRPKKIFHYLSEDVPLSCPGSGCVHSLEVSPMGNLEFHQARTLMEAQPNKYGVYSAPEKVYYRPAEALRLADWIYDTFAEKP